MVHPSLEQLRVYAHSTGPKDVDLEARLDACPSCEALFVAEVAGLTTLFEDDRTLDEILRASPSRK